MAIQQVAFPNNEYDVFVSLKNLKLIEIQASNTSVKDSNYNFISGFVNFW